MVARNAVAVVLLVLFAGVALADMPLSMGDWEGNLFLNGNTTPANTNSVTVCIYVGTNATPTDTTTVGAETSGFYLLHASGQAGQAVNFRVFCEYPVFENPQVFAESPPRHYLNLTINHTTPPAITVVSPVGSSVPIGANTMRVLTNESAWCRYSLTSGVAYDAMAAGNTTTIGMNHSWAISAPAYSTTYTYYVKCRDQFNFTSGDAVVSFTTVPVPGPTPYIPPSGGGPGGGGGSAGPTPTPRPGASPGGTPLPPGCNPVGGSCASAADCCDVGALCTSYVCTMPTPAPTATPQIVINITVPGTFALGGLVPITVVNAVTGAPLAGITIVITTPSGEQLSVVTDANGAASFRAEEEGVYDYDAPGYRQSQPHSTNVLPAGVTPTRTPVRTPTPHATPTPTPGGGWFGLDLALIGIVGFAALVGLVGLAAAALIYRRLTRRRGL